MDRDRLHRAPPWIESGPRIDVVLERTYQYRAFAASEYGWDPGKQRAVARLFMEEMDSPRLPSIFGRRPRLSRGKVELHDIFVCFSDFERVAKIEAHEGVTRAELAQFSASLGLGSDVFWCIQRSFGPPIVFVYTDEQASELRSSPQRRRWSDAYFAFVRTHDEFGYLDREDIDIEVDSKQNLDDNYSGNWWYYFK